MPLDPAVDKVLKDNGLGNDAVWQHKQSRSWIMKHWACEHAAIKAGIQFDAPVVIDADASNKVAVICVTGRLGEHVQWSFGEAAPYNTQQTYPFAMAEKRAKDRVILKLLGVHGKVYSEEEADDFREPPKERPGDGVRAAAVEPKIIPNAAEKEPPKDSRSADWQGPLKKGELKDNMIALAAAIGDAPSNDALDELMDEYGEVWKQALHDTPGWIDGTGMPAEFVPLQKRLDAKRSFFAGADNLNAA